jgi:endoglucanase
MPKVRSARGDLMTKPIWAAATALALTTFAGRTAAAQTPGREAVREWWKESYPPALKSADARKLPLISVKANRFVDPQDKTVLFRGVSISDPDKMEAQGHWSRQHFVKLQEYGARLVRIPVHPVAWRLRGPKAYLALLDQAVAWCTELGLYVALDWHSIGNLQAGLFQDPMYETSLPETAQFWRTIASRYAGHNTVAFYELFNEPTSYQNQLGPARWQEWKRINEDLIAIVRAFDHEKIPLVAGFDWDYDLTPLLEAPIQAEGIGYSVHPYPWKRSKPWEPKWEENFGFAAASYPLVATEIGFEGDGKDARFSGYGDAITGYLESKGISWVAWVFDPDWGPQLLRSWNYDLTGSGEFFGQALKRPLPAAAPPSR